MADGTIEYIYRWSFTKNGRVYRRKPPQSPYKIRVRRPAPSA